MMRLGGSVVGFSDPNATSASKGETLKIAGGVIGAFITITVIQSMAGLGPAKAAMLIVISQLVVAYLIELLGIFGMEKASFEWRKVIGMAVAIGGIILFKWES